MKVARLTPEDILKNWPVIESSIQKSLKHSVSESSTFDIFQWLMNPDYAQCWVVFDDNNNLINISVTKINKYAQHISLHIVTTTSVGKINWDAYKEAHHVIEDYARSIGAVRVEAYGRPGWKRKIKKLNGKHGETYKESYTVISMFLEETK